MKQTLREYLTYLAENEIDIRVFDDVELYTENKYLDGCGNIIDSKKITKEKLNCCFSNDMLDDYLVVAAIIMNDNLCIKVEPNPKPENQELEIVGIL